MTLAEALAELRVEPGVDAESIRRAYLQPIVSNQRKATLVVEQTPGRLTAAQIASARQELERLKFHPREALPNTTALARADALYVELTGPARAGMGEAIAFFRGALDEQEPRAIDAARAQLLDLVDRLGGRS